MGLFVLALFILTPLAEIAVFIQMGDLIGLWPTLATIVLTAVIGTALLRAQGLRTIERARQQLEAGGMPVTEAVHGVFLLIAGALLLTPGFITDAVGFLLLVPQVRAALSKRLAEAMMRNANVSFTVMGAGQESGPRPPGGPGSVIDAADWTEVESSEPPGQGPRKPQDPGDDKSPWSA